MYLFVPCDKKSHGTEISFPTRSNRLSHPHPPGFKNYMSYPQKSKFIEIPSLSASFKLNLFVLIFYIRFVNLKTSNICCCWTLFLKLKDQKTYVTNRTFKRRRSLWERYRPAVSHWNTILITTTDGKSGYCLRAWVTYFCSSSSFRAFWKQKHCPINFLDC